MKNILVLIMIVFLAGCTVKYRQHVVQPFVDGEYWKMHEAMYFEVGNTGEYIVVPKGFVTDFASTPSLLKSVFPKSGPYLVGAIVHDYLYWNQSCTKEQADNIFLQAMEKAKIGSIKRKTIWAAVDNFGSSAWEENSKRKKSGYIKVIPESHMNVPYDMTWEIYVELLKNEGVEDEDEGTDLSKICRLSDTLST